MFSVAARLSRRWPSSAGRTDNARPTGCRIEVDTAVTLRSKRCGATFALGLVAAALGGWAPAAHAACSDNAPTTGQTVTCDTSPPNPDLNGVIAEAGSTDVTVNVLSGAGIITSANNDVTAVQVRTDSQVHNQGTVTALGEGELFVVRGLFAAGSNNVLSNSGMVETTGVGAEDNSFASGLVAEGSGNTLVSSGTVISTASGFLAGIGRGLFADGDNNTLTNSGTVTVLSLGGFASGLEVAPIQGGAVE
jgi:hypothetical protein